MKSTIGRSVQIEFLIQKLNFFLIIFCCPRQIGRVFDQLRPLALRLYKIHSIRKPERGEKVHNFSAELSCFFVNLHRCWTVLIQIFILASKERLFFSISFKIGVFLLAKHDERCYIDIKCEGSEDWRDVENPEHSI